jgi:hypothetical protein
MGMKKRKILPGSKLGHLAQNNGREFNSQPKASRGMEIQSFPTPVKGLTLK